MSCWSNRRAVAVQAGAGPRVRSRTRFGSHSETRRRPVGALHRSRPANAHRERELVRREPWPAPAQGKRDRHRQRGPLQKAIGNDPQSMESQRARQFEPKCREKGQEGRFRLGTPPPAKNAGRIPSGSEVLRIEGTSFKRIRCRRFGGNSHGMSTPAGSKRVHPTRKATNPFLHRCAKKGLREFRDFYFAEVSATASSGLCAMTKPSLSPSFWTVTASPGLMLPLSTSSAIGSSMYFSTARRIGRAP